MDTLVWKVSQILTEDFKHLVILIQLDVEFLWTKRSDINSVISIILCCQSQSMSHFPTWWLSPETSCKVTYCFIVFSSSKDFPAVMSSSQNVYLVDHMVHRILWNSMCFPTTNWRTALQKDSFCICHFFTGGNQCNQYLPWEAINLSVAWM